MSVFTKFAITAAVAMLGLSAQATTQRSFESIDLDADSGAQALTLRQFDAALGTLNGVSITLQGEVVQHLKAENTSALPSSITPTALATFFFGGTGVAQQSQRASGVGSTFEVSAFDGRVDYAGSSGRDFGEIVVSALTSWSYSDGARLADFVGRGTLGSMFSVRAEGIGTQWSAGGNYDALVTSRGRYGVTVVYDYIAADVAPSAPVPAPGSLALVGLALLGLGLVGRRKA